METVELDQAGKRKPRVGLCVGLGIGLGVFGVWAFWLFAPCGPNRPSPDSAAFRKLREFAAKLETYRTVSGDYPTQEQGLMALVEWPEADPVPGRWKQQFKVLPKDPWGREYRYSYPGRVDPERWEVVSGGADMEFGTDDDISSGDLE